MRLTIALVGLALTMAATVGCGSPGQSQPSLGDVVSDGTWEVKVTGVRVEQGVSSEPYDPSSSGFSAQDGYQFVVVEAEWRNLVNDTVLFSTESLHLVQRPDFKVFPANLTSEGEPWRWSQDTLLFTQPADRDKSKWTQVGVAFAIKRGDAHDLSLQLRDLTPIDLGLE